MASGRIGRFSGRDDLKQQLKASAKSAKEARRQRDPGDAEEPFRQRAAGDFFHNKLVSFGGGFYGTMALLTYVLIEAVEIWQFLVSLADPETWVERLGMELLIGFLLNSLMNLFAAVIWFSTLPGYIRMENGLVWLAAAYGGYLAGLHVTSRWGESIWARAAEILRARRS